MAGILAGDGERPGDREVDEAGEILGFSILRVSPRARNPLEVAL
jgi:hypothetical protein